MFAKQNKKTTEGGNGASIDDASLHLDAGSQGCRDEPSATPTEFTGGTCPRLISRGEGREEPRDFGRKVCLHCCGYLAYEPTVWELVTTQAQQGIG